MNFTINVENKVAIAIDPPEIICGNSDYVIDFVFDKEWEEYEVKVAVFTFKRDGRKKYLEQVFMGTQCEVPVLTGIEEVTIGVYAGNLETTTGATVKTKKSILCDVSKAEDPHNDVFCQLLEILKDHFPLEAIEAAQQAAQMAIDAASGVEIVEQNHKGGLTFWVGTQEEYNQIQTISEKCFYIITDDRTQEQLDIINDSVKPWNVEDRIISISTQKDLGIICSYNAYESELPFTEHRYNLIAKHYGKIRVKFNFDHSGTGSARPVWQFNITCNDKVITTEEIDTNDIINDKASTYVDIDVEKGVNPFSIMPKITGGQLGGNDANINISIVDFHLCANYDTPFVYVYDDFLVEEE